MLTLLDRKKAELEISGIYIDHRKVLVCSKYTIVSNKENVVYIDVQLWYNHVLSMFTTYTTSKYMLLTFYDQCA